jgi:hypothetical protein
MTEFYTNLPPKDKDQLQKTIDQLKDGSYVEPHQFNQNDYDATIAFFVKRGFTRESAETTSYIILQQAKIDEVSVGEILDKLTYASPSQLSELITIVLNENRFKTSKLGVRANRRENEVVSRNIID